MRTTVFAVLLALSCLRGTLAVEPFDGVGVRDYFFLDKLLFVYFDEDFRSSSQDVINLDRTSIGKDLVERAFPNAEIRDLIDWGLEEENKLRFSDLTLRCGLDERECSVSITWSLLPETGGSTGIPYEFRAWLRSDNTSVIPKIYLWDVDHYNHDINNPGENPSSIRYYLSLDDLTLPEGSKPKYGLEIQRTATEFLSKFVRGNNGHSGLKPKYKFHSQFLIEDLPGDRKAWAVDFVDVTNAKDPNNFTPNDQNWFTIYLTEDGRAGRIQAGPAL